MSGQRHDLPVDRQRTTLPQRLGDRGEQLAARHLEALGWRILARNLRLGRVEVDILAVDPSEPPSLVVVEVRFRSRRDFGLVEETVDFRKRAMLRRAVSELAVRGGLPEASRTPGLPVRVDLVAIDLDPLGGTRLRHHRAIEL